MTQRPTLARIAATGVALAALGAGLMAGPADAGITVPQLDAKVTPDPSTPGAALTITPATSPDDFCPDGDTLEWSITGNATDVDLSGSTDVDDTGSWTITTAPDEPDTYDFEGFCTGQSLPPAATGIAPAGGSAFFGEYAASFTVEGELDPFQATLDKFSGPPGDDIQLAAIACFGDLGAALFMPPGAVPDFSQDLVDQGLQQYEVQDNQFGGVVPVPADTAPGTYQVVAWCLDTGQLAADPVVLSYTVLAPGAVPVAAEPAFTG